MPFQSKKGQKVSACCKHLYYCEIWERLREPFQSNKGQTFSASSRQLKSTLLWNERKAEGALSKQKKGKKFLPAAGTYTIVNWERGWGSYSFTQQGFLSRLLSSAQLLLLIQNNTRGLETKQSQRNKKEGETISLLYSTHNSSWAVLILGWWKMCFPFYTERECETVWSQIPIIKAIILYYYMKWKLHIRPHTRFLFPKF